MDNTYILDETESFFGDYLDRVYDESWGLDYENINRSLHDNDGCIRELPINNVSRGCAKAIKLEQGCGGSKEIRLEAI